MGSYDLPDSQHPVPNDHRPDRERRDSDHDLKIGHGHPSAADRLHAASAMTSIVILDSGRVPVESSADGLKRSGIRPAPASQDLLNLPRRALEIPIVAAPHFSQPIGSAISPARPIARARRSSGNVEQQLRSKALVTAPRPGARPAGSAVRFGHEE